MQTITVDQVREIAPEASISKWEKYGKVRHYISISGTDSKLWIDESDNKLHVRDARGLETSEALKTIGNLIGCNPVDRYTKAAEYVVMER